MKAGYVIALALLCGGTAAQAQRDDGSYGRPEPTPENMARMALRGSAFCALKRASATAEKVLASAIGSEEEAKKVKSLRTVARDCYRPNWPVFPATAVHNAIAEAQYREHYKTAPKQLAPGAPPPASFAVSPAGATGTPEQEAAWYLGALANCVVFADSTGAYNLVVGPTSVPEEDKRFDKLKPALGRCEGAGAPKLTSRDFRGYLATALLAQARADETE